MLTNTRITLSEQELKEIHSARYRIKAVESLLAKYVKKKALLPEEYGNNYNIGKYRPINEYNYYKIIRSADEINSFDFTNFSSVFCYNSCKSFGKMKSFSLQVFDKFHR